MRLSKLARAAVISLTLITACGGPAPPPTVGTGPTQGPVATPAGQTSEPVGPTNPPVGTVDVCGLLTAAEISAATEQDYSEGTVDSVGQCLWNTEGNTTNTGSLIVGYIQPQTLSFMKSTFGSGGVDVTVGGHAAFYNPTQGLGTLWIDIGAGQLLSLSFPRSFDLNPSYQALALQLAEIALSRM